MALLPNVRRVSKEEVKDSPAWFDTFLGYNNTFNDQVYDALDGNLTFNHNIASQEKEIDFVTLPTYLGGDFTAIKFPVELRTKVRGLELMQIYKKDAPQSPILEAVFVNWYQDNLTFVIPFIVGLENEMEYILRIRLT